MNKQKLRCKLNKFIEEGFYKDLSESERQRVEKAIRIVNDLSTPINIRIFIETEKMHEFNFKPGYAYFENKLGEKFATSGWNCNDSIYIYELTNGVWNGKWHEIKFYSEILNKIEEYEDDIALKEAKKEAEIKKEELYVIEKGSKLCFIDVIGGRLSDNGGQYEFSSHYIATKYPGVYKYYTKCSCDFDDCGTGFKGYEVLTCRDFNNLCKVEKRIIDEGCQY